MKIAIFLFLIFINYSFACDLSSLEKRSPVSVEGKVKSFQVASYFSVKKLFGKTNLSEASRVYCLIVTNDAKSLRSEELYKNSGIKYLEEISNIPKLYFEMENTNDEVLKQAKFENYIKVKLFQDIYHGKHLLLYEKTWLPINTVGNVLLENLTKKLDLSSKSYKKQNYIFENILIEFKLVQIAFVLALIGILSLFLPTNRRFIIFYSFVLTSFVLQLIIITLRTLYLERVPLANMYETVLLSAPFAILIGLITLKKNRFIMIVSSAYSVGCLALIFSSSTMLDSEMKNIMPVLRDNFWLSTHVTAIVFSYSLLALSWGSANYYMIASLFKSKINAEQVNSAIKLSIQYGTFFLFIGIFMGAIWADYSWGRFWAWDPKETWSLIAFLIYMILLHGIRGKLVKNEMLYIYTASAFMSILMAWFGVNFVLSTGLHSYGFSSGGTSFLVTLVLVQIILILTFSKRNKERSVENYS